SQDRARVAQYTPFIKIPPILYPKLSNPYKAPVMHCGWVMDRLRKYTEDNDFVVTLTYDYREKFTEDEIGDEDPIVVACVNPLESMNNALADLMGKLGITEILKTVDIEIVVTENKALFVSLYTNYSVRCTPAAEAIEKLRVALGEEEGPKWYLDYFDLHWTPKLPSAIRAKPYVDLAVLLVLLLIESPPENVRLAHRRRSLFRNDHGRFLVRLVLLSMISDDQLHQYSL
ncbi:hypothetical protein HETIRDRAFT_313928, partial [Heterobasidion irregulare TC 32-1]